MKLDLRIPVSTMGMILGSLATVGLSQPARAADPPRTQLVVYLEVADPSGEDIAVSIGACRLMGDGRSVTLDPSMRSLNAGVILGRQVNWVEQWIPAGHYDHLALDIEAVEGTIGRARVRPSVPEEPIRVPLDRYLDPEEATLAILRWTPHPVEPDAAVHVPQLQFVDPQIPPLGSLAFVSNEGSGNLSVIDRFTGKIVDVFAAGEKPRGLAYSELNQWLYVADAGASEIVAIDVLSMSRVKQSPLPYGSEPSRLAVDDFQNVLYVLSYGSEILSVLDPLTLEEIDRVMIGRGPRGLALDRKTGRVYVSLELDGLVQVYDPVERRLIAPLAVGTAPGELVFSDAGVLYVSDGSQRRVAGYNSVTGEVSRGLTLCSAAQGLVFNPVSRRLYAAQTGCRAIAVLQPERELDIGSIRLPGNPGLIALDQNYRHLLVTLPQSNQVIVYNANSRGLEGTVEVGERPYAVVVP